ncbi:MAG TPA: tetratricopeptide repeat protein, partial [Thermoanaerobaculia bacterium]|nr:tetratricopeptide repeat protein [Thermoanaerobaculia bacterium]
NNLGNLYRFQNRLDEARQAYEGALKIRRDLVKKNPETYLPGLAVTLTMLGTVDSQRNRPDAARQALEEARRILEELSKRDQNYVKILAKVKEDLDGLPKPSPLPDHP